MHSHSRSRDANIGTKTCKHRSIDTKVQSTLSSSPRNKKSTPTSKTKQKSIKDEKKTIKASAKLKYFVTKITTKLQQFDKQSIMNTPSTSSNISQIGSQTISSVSYNSSEHQQYNKSTEVIIERLKSDKGLSKEKCIHQNYNGLVSNKQSNYNEVFEQALSRPHCLYRLMMQKRNPVINGKTSIISEFKQFKKKQCQNWILINSQLTNYLKQQAEEENNKDRKKIQQMLIRQGKSNYQWVQIQDKLRYENFEEVILQRSIQQSKKSTISIKKVEPSKQEQQQIENEIKDQPVGQMLLSNLNWQKYIWDDEASSTSDLQCNSRVNSDIEYLHISAKDFIQETDQVQENVELIVNWLMDQFVVELAHKLDFNLMIGFRTDKKMDKNNEKQKLEDEGQKSFIQSINQICEDSNIIRQIDLSQGPKPIPQYYSDAFLEVEAYNPRLSKKQVKQQLIKNVVNRDIELCEIYLIDEEQEEQWIRMSFLYELEEIVWQALIMEQTCRLWMG